MPVLLRAGMEEEGGNVISLQRLRARKLFGVIMGSLAGLFAVLFLFRALFTWAPIPDGVLGLLGILTGGFGGYVASSSYEATHGKEGPHEEV